MGTSPRTIIDYSARFAGNPHEHEILGIIAAAKTTNSVLREWFEKARNSTNPNDVLGSTVKSTHFADFGFEDAFTLADKASEDALIPLLKKIKDIPVVSEEAGHEVEDAQIPNGARRWLVDPIDGTYCFKKGSADFSITIALQKKVNGAWETEIGAVSIPMHDEIYIADTSNAYLIQDEREKLVGTRGPEATAFSGSADDAIRGKRIESVIYSKDDPITAKLRTHMLDKLSSLGAAMDTWSTALMVSRMTDGWLDGAVIGGNTALEFPWDTDAAFHIAEKAGMETKRFEIGQTPFMLIANSKTLLRALETTVRDQYRQSSPGLPGH